MPFRWWVSWRSNADEATGDPPGEVEEEAPANEGKNPAAVALGGLGGKKGGKARAAKLTRERRSGIARKTDQARWNLSFPRILPLEVVAVRTWHEVIVL